MVGPLGFLRQTTDRVCELFFDDVALLCYIFISQNMRSVTFSSRLYICRLPLALMTVDSKATFLFSIEFYPLLEIFSDIGKAENLVNRLNNLGSSLTEQLRAEILYTIYRFLSLCLQCLLVAIAFRSEAVTIYL